MAQQGRAGDDVLATLRRKRRHVEQELAASAILAAFNVELLVLSLVSWGNRDHVCSSRCGGWRSSAAVVVAHDKRYSVAAKIDGFPTL
jgi:hypothetical protein